MSPIPALSPGVFMPSPLPQIDYLPPSLATAHDAIPSAPWTDISRPMMRRDIDGDCGCCCRFRSGNMTAEQAKRASIIIWAVVGSFMGVIILIFLACCIAFCCSSDEKERRATRTKDTQRAQTHSDEAFRGLEIQKQKVRSEDELNEAALEEITRVYESRLDQPRYERHVLAHNKSRYSRR
ncbi:hypothetical protein BT63DRAFT_456445 [Microthyrium microscopicum]|uniref:Uncharacterized protein n=1 Tax=Microthyrium microscopicum TaxID=703497 RepID=A0A6A6UD10_9PEZI|nr:hypothetical protein BT63DRAFT_456445 [Microthyrium microscopicum]